jgi:hypothetical protein
VLTSLNAVGKGYPNPAQAARIIAEHQQRVGQIVRQGRHQPRRASRQACKQAAGDLPLVINLLCSLLIFAGFLTVAWVTNSLAWPLLIPAVALFLVGSFLWQ